MSIPKQFCYQNIFHEYRQFFLSSQVRGVLTPVGHFCAGHFLGWWWPAILFPFLVFQGTVSFLVSLYVPSEALALFSALPHLSTLYQIIGSWWEPGCFKVCGWSHVGGRSLGHPDIYNHGISQSTRCQHCGKQRRKMSWLCPWIRPGQKETSHLVSYLACPNITSNSKCSSTSKYEF